MEPADKVRLRIANFALGVVGSKKITKFTERTKEAELCVQFINNSINSMLSRHDWSFGRETKALALLGRTDSFDLFTYQIPADCARKLYITKDPDGGFFSEDNRYPVNEQSGTIVSPIEKAYLRYISKGALPHVNDFFETAVAYHLAIKIAPSLALGNNSVNFQRFEIKVAQNLAEAQEVDSSGRGVDKEEQSDTPGEAVMPERKVQTNFSGGIISPLLTMFTQLQKRNNGLRDVRNFIVEKYGSLANRAGLELVADGDASKVPLRVESFSFGSDENYCLVFGDKWIRIIEDGRYLVEKKESFTATVSGETVSLEFGNAPRKERRRCRLLEVLS